MSATTARKRPTLPAARFVYRSRVHFDELDAMRILHNSRYAVHVERATIAHFEWMGFPWRSEVSDNSDQFHVVPRFSVELHRPFTGIGELHVGLWVDRLGRSSCEYGFVCADAGGDLYASGKRVIVKLDSASMRPSPWTEPFRAGLAGLLVAAPRPAGRCDDGRA